MFGHTNYLIRHIAENLDMANSTVAGIKKYIKIGKLGKVPGDPK